MCGMTVTIHTSGSLSVKPISCSGGTTPYTDLGLGRLGAALGSRTAEAKVTQTDTIATIGAVGASFVPLSALSDLSEVQFLWLRSSANIGLRLSANPAEVQAAAGAFPTLFAGGETLITTIDGAPVTTTFLVGDQTAVQCVARINAAMALAGIATPRASVVNGQIKITGVATKAVGSVGVLSFAGTGAVTLGLDAGSVTPTPAQGQDLFVSGECMIEFPSDGGLAPTAVEVSGQASIDVVAAGKA